MDQVISKSSEINVDINLLSMMEKRYRKSDSTYKK